MNWRWDQGRLDYFQFDELRRAATALSALDGVALPKGSQPDLLRKELARTTNRPFAPRSYTVWRNYGRVFEAQLLAANVSGVLRCTNICTALATDSITSDEYFLHFARGFSYPFPGFADYSHKVKPIFPVCAILKLLVANYVYTDHPLISLDDVVERVRNQNFDGSEPLLAYSKASNKVESISEDERRQIRELLIFVSQLSFLKWNNPHLILDLPTKESALQLASVLQPAIHRRHDDPSMEILSLGSISGAIVLPDFEKAPIGDINDQEFVEGTKGRVTHLRVERSGKLRDFFFQYKADADTCDMCEMKTLLEYPWLTRLIEVHHLLPLSSPIHVDAKKTSLKDLVGLCPSCHRATHKFYSKWLKGNGAKDFLDKSQAVKVYGLAKTEFAA